MDQHIPPGIAKNTAEFFVHQGKLKVMYQGNTISVKQLPSNILASIARKLETDAEAKKQLNNLNVVGFLPRLEKYLSCRYGGFDQVADLVNGTLQEADYTPCPMRGNCISEGKLCKPVKGINGSLTPRELQVLKLAAVGKQEKEIADALHCAPRTVTNHMASLFKKTGAGNKTELALFAHKKNLLAC